MKYLINLIYDTNYIMEEEYLLLHPIIICKEGFTTRPETTNNVLALQHQNITSIFLATINYLRLEILDISGNSLKHLPDIFTLKILVCDDCELKDLPSYMPCLEKLSCKNNFLRSIPSYKKLTELDCSSNLITCIEGSYSNDADKTNINETNHDISTTNNKCMQLKKLTCNNNPIMSINIPTLTYLEAYNCPIKILHRIPGLFKRSSTMDTNNFKWTVISCERLDRSGVIINWQNGTKKINTKLFDKVSKFLFV